MDLFDALIHVLKEIGGQGDRLTIEEISRQVHTQVDERSMVRNIATLFLIGISVSIGRSYLLLANNVSLRRMIASMIFGVIPFVSSIFVWAAAIYGIGLLFYDIDFTWTYLEINALVMLAFVPLTQAWLGVIPYVGSCWIRYLYVQSVGLLYFGMLLIGFGWQQAIVAILLGSIVLLIAQLTIMRPLTALQNRIAGTHLKRRYRQIIRAK